LAVLDLIRSLRDAQADPQDLTHHLDALHRRLTTFSEADVELLEEAGLLMTPHLQHSLASGSPAPA
jgi:hypothetical protein